VLRRGGRIMGRSVRGAEVCCTFFNNQSVGVVVLDWSKQQVCDSYTSTLFHSSTISYTWCWCYPCTLSANRIFIADKRTFHFIIV
jgi:hypothetical protein